MKLNSYRDLLIWKKGVDLVEESYKLTAKLPKTERFGLISQMDRAALSVPGNIAEGFGRSTRGEFLRSLHIAKGSLCELETYFIVCTRLGYVNRDDIRKAWATADEVGKLLTRTIQKIKSKGRGHK